MLSLIKSSIYINILLWRNRFYPFPQAFWLYTYSPFYPGPTEPWGLPESHWNPSQSSVWPRFQYKGLECLYTHSRALFLFFTFIIWDELITEISQNEKWGWPVLAQNPATRMQASMRGGSKSEVFQNVSHPSDVNPLHGNGMKILLSWLIPQTCEEVMSHRTWSVWDYIIERVEEESKGLVKEQRWE